MKRPTDAERPCQSQPEIRPPIAHPTPQSERIPLVLMEALIERSDQADTGLHPDNYPLPRYLLFVRHLNQAPYSKLDRNFTTPNRKANPPRIKSPRKSLHNSRNPTPFKKTEKPISKKYFKGDR